MKSHWYRESVKAIDAALKTLDRTASKAEVIRAVRDAYPFGPRAHWPYKKWCEAQRDMLYSWNPRMFPKPSHCGKREQEDPAQIPMFGGAK